MKKLLYVFLLASLISCATNIPNVQLQRRVYNEPALNESVTKEIGERLVSQGEEDFQEAVKITSIDNSNIRFYGTAFPYFTGDILPLSGQNQSYKYYYRKSDNKVTSTGRYNSSEVSYGIAVRKSDNKPFVFYNQVMGSLGGMQVKESAGLQIENTTFTDPNCKNCFKQEFIFNGKVDNNLKFIYREYTENMARPAFTQELQYDLKDSNIIGFKGLRLEVIKATNTSIEYKVNSYFSK